MKNSTFNKKSISKAVAMAAMVTLPSLASAQLALPTAVITDTLGGLGDVSGLTGGLSSGLPVVGDLASGGLPLVGGLTSGGLPDVGALTGLVGGLPDVAGLASGGLPDLGGLTNGLNVLEGTSALSGLTDALPLNGGLPALPDLPVLGGGLPGLDALGDLTGGTSLVTGLLPNDISGLAGPALQIATGAGLPFASSTVLPIVGDLQNSVAIDGAILGNVGNLRSGDPAKVISALTSIAEAGMSDVTNFDPAIITDVVAGLDPAAFTDAIQTAAPIVTDALGNLEIPTL